MSSWLETIQQSGHVPKWPYPIEYGKERSVLTDVLIIGGGIAGCHAAINAARKGAKVVVVEKGMTKRSGRGGAGVDHWLAACTNPCSLVTPEEWVEELFDASGGFTSGPARYIQARESWDALLDCEKMGVQIRDVDDEFKGADFRDEATKLMFAYDYKNRHHIRVWGFNIKPSLYKEMRRLKVEMHDRVMATSLLTEGGRQGAKVVGATGINMRTGEFTVFQAKATIIATCAPRRNWVFAPELQGSGNFVGMNESGDGHAIGWNAGAEFAGMEDSNTALPGFGYIPYGMGNANNTYLGSSIVDNNGKEVPWLNRKGEQLSTVEERFLPGEGEKFMIGAGVGVARLGERAVNALVPDLPERLRKGEFALPLYMDLTRLPVHERRAIFGMMVGNEGRTRIPVYDTYTKAGFDPDKDMLQAPVMPLDAYSNSNFWAGASSTIYRRSARGGFLVDWDLRTSLEGLYAAGGSIFGNGAHSDAATTGRYAGRKAAVYALTAADPIIDRIQVEAEKKRVYTPLAQGQNDMGWKELNAGIVRVMQEYCGPYKTEETLKIGLSLLEELKNCELASARAVNPHELARLLECHSIITVGKLIMQASLARKASNTRLGFVRLDYPEMDPPEWRKLVPLRLMNGEVAARELALDHHLREPYAPTYVDNYKKHCDL
ncbi:MAG TPA: FAD-dependent oxidoreductase [Syntrophorhabdaceae bacterium]|nr:FAD-dependent oxidoreductase [Syntrophorhabdaceae bacterium]